MLSVHLALSRGTRPDWQAQSLRSVRRAIDAAGYPVELNVIDGVPGHIGRMRAQGYAAGSGDWKTYVDDDDCVDRDAFRVLGEHMAVTDAVAIAPRERVEQNGRLHGFTVGCHHLITYRAEFIDAFPHADWVCLGDVAASVMAKRDPRGVLEIDDALYTHRIYLKSRARQLRADNLQEVDRVRALEAA